MTTVNCKTTKVFDVYIGRGAEGKVSDVYGERGYWGNPIKLTEDTPRKRKECILQYWDWLISTDPGRERLTRVHELKGKILACWCAPNLCHGHVLEILANDPNGYQVVHAKMRATQAQLDAEDKE